MGTDALGAAVEGIHRGYARMQSSAERMTREVSPEAAVEMTLAQQQVEASVAVTRVIDESLGLLLDELA